MDPLVDGPAVVSEYRLDERETVVVAGTLAAVTLAAIYWVSRIGFDNPVRPVVEALGLSLFLIATPMWIARALRPSDDAGWWKSQSVMTIGCLVLTMIAGLGASKTGMSAVIAFAITGFALALWTFVRWIGRASILKSLAFLTGAMVFTVWCAGVIWGSRYKMPLFWETMTWKANIHHDTFYYGSIANMLDTYGVPTTGLDGIPIIRYHFGSPWLFAQWAHLLNVDVLSFYSLGYPVIVLPLFFSALLLFSVELRAAFGIAHGEGLRSDWRAWLFFLAATVGFLPTVALDALAVWNSNAFISESYLIAMPVFFLLLGSALAFWAANKTSKPRTGGVSAIAYLMVFLPLMLAASGFLKISLMLLSLGVALWLFLRLGLFRRPVAVASLLLSFVAVGLTYRVVSLPAQNGGISPLHFMRFDAAEGWQQFFPLIHLLWTWVYIALRVWEDGARDVRSLIQSIRAGRLIDAEVLLVVAVLGFLPGEIVSIHGGSAIYFSDVQRWLALSFIVARLPIWVGNWKEAKSRNPQMEGNGVRSVRLATVLGVLVVLPFVVTLLLNLAQWPVRVLRANVALRRELIAQTDSPVGGIRSLGNHELLRQGETRSMYYPIVTALRDIARLPAVERQHALLFIPQSNTQYWSMFTADDRCSYTPLIAPAIASVAMLDGMPSAGCTVTEQYNMTSYHARSTPQTAADTTDPVLCAKARKAGFREVLVLDSPDKIRLRRRRIDCYLL